MKSILNLFCLVLLLGISSCSSDDIPVVPQSRTIQESMTKNDLGTPMLVTDFIDLVKSTSTEIELEFLYSLDPNDTLYVYEQSKVQFPHLDSTNIEIYKKVAREGIAFSSLSIEPTIKSEPKSRSWGDDFTEYRIATIGVKMGYNPLLEEDVRIYADVSYGYNTTQFIIDKTYPISIVPYTAVQGNPSIMLDFANQGSSAHASDDITISYAVLGQVRLSAAFGDFGAGAVIDQVSEYGSFIVGY